MRNIPAGLAALMLGCGVALAQTVPPGTAGNPAPGAPGTPTPAPGTTTPGTATGTPNPAAPSPANPGTTTGAPMSPAPTTNAEPETPAPATNGGPATPKKGANSFTRGQASARLRRHGFAHLASLHKDQDGIWRARATRNGKPVNVWLDYQGNVGQQ